MKVSDLSIEERHKLFPVIVREYDPQWEQIYNDESSRLLCNVDNIAAIHHIGSTSVKGLHAKPTIDILIEINKNADLGLLKKQFMKLGYDIEFELPDKPLPRLTFLKGYTLKGVSGQTYHVHIKYVGGVDERIMFRDYLRSHPSAVAEYAKLKIKLQKQFEFDRESYGNAKTEFIKDILKKAYKGR